MNKNLNIEAEGSELILKNKAGDYVIIPKKHRLEVQDMIKDGCHGCIDSLVDTLPVMTDYAGDGSLLPNDEENPMLTNIYQKYPAFKNMGKVTLKADKSFTREATGVGDIETFVPIKGQGEEYNTTTYSNGYKVQHPKPGTVGIVYNPDTNDEQNIMLDMLHGMVLDPVYSKHRQEFKDSFMKSEFSSDINREWDKYNKESNGNNDGKDKFIDNEIDGVLRNLMFEGTDEDFNKERYWKDAKKVYLKDKELDTKYKQLNNYLQVGQGYMLPEVTITAKKTN